MSSDTTSQADPAAGLGDIALAAARAGSDAIARTVAAGGMRTDAKSAPQDLVTSADRASEAAIVDLLTRERPEDAILGEESGAHPGRSEVRWIVDPLDGTVNFIYGRAGWGVSVGAEVGGVATVGAIVCPADGRWAVADPTGVRFGGYESADGLVAIPHPPRSAEGLEIAAADALVSLGQPYDLDKRRELMEIAARLVVRIRGLRLTGAAASELLGVSGGDADAYVSFDLGPWDTAAGVVLVEACGGAIRDAVTPGGMPVVIAARTAALAEQLATWIGEARPPADPERPDGAPQPPPEPTRVDLTGGLP